MSFINDCCLVLYTYLSSYPEKFFFTQSISITALYCVTTSLSVWETDSKWGLTCWAFGQQRARIFLFFSFFFFFLAGNSWEVSGHFLFIADNLVLIFENVEINTDLAVKMTWYKRLSNIVPGIIPHISNTHAINFATISECPYRGIPWNKFKRFKESIPTQF